MRLALPLPLACLAAGDGVAQMELLLALRPPQETSELRSVSHACEHRERTYAWPSQAVVEKTLDACLHDLLTAFRADFLL